MAEATWVVGDQEHDGGLGRMIRLSFLLRLGTVALTTVSFVRTPPTPWVLAATVAVGAVSIAGFLAEERVTALCVRHPLIVLADVVGSMAVVNIVGVNSPLVLASLTTVFIVGLILELRAGTVVVVGAVALYLLAVADSENPDFLTSAVIPLLYVALFTIAHAYRRSTREQVRGFETLARVRADESTANERARLAREMHDSLAKTLHGIAMGATALPDWVERDPARAIEYARALADGAEQAAAEARAILVRMRADQPDRPLAEILGALCQEFAQEAGLRCTFEAHDVADVPHEARYELVSIAGEALENVRRHADASEVGVSLQGRPDSVELVVADNGRGFDATAAGPKGHFGMQGMTERARQVGGDLTVTSCPAEGTTIRVRIPVAQEGDERGIA
ncbi:sensor histidine kinase [Angustibacter luteus]|uniref:histidine kinase n=1 Tax=Angustibacter luteus TaxID=658456 RepID=A0ABW1J8R6_9ACTN